MSALAPHFAFRTATLLPAIAAAAVAGDAHRAVQGGSAARAVPRAPRNALLRAAERRQRAARARVSGPDSHRFARGRADAGGEDLGPALLDADIGAPARTRRRRRMRGGSSRIDTIRSARRGSRDCCGRRTSIRATASSDPAFPRVDVVEDGKDAAWRSAPKARLLPSRWIAIVQAAGPRHCRGRRPRHSAGPRRRSRSAGRCRQRARDSRRPGGGRRRHALDGRLRRGRSSRAWDCAFRSPPRISRAASKA